MASMANIAIIGNVGRDPEMRYTAGGQAFTSFSVAVSHKGKTTDGESKDETDWFRVTCWGKLAEIASQYVRKGRQVYVDGRFVTSHYTTEAGENRTSMDITAVNLQLLGEREQGGGESKPAAAAAPDMASIPF